LVLVEQALKEILLRVVAEIVLLDLSLRLVAVAVLMVVELVEDLVVGAELLDNHRELFVVELELLVKEILVEKVDMVRELVVEVVLEHRAQITSWM
jgi:hypothetical protein